MKGAHDDSIMSMSIAIYAGDICFTQLTRNENINKSIMEAWMLSEKTYEPNKSIYSYGRAFDPMGVISIDGNGMVKENPLFQNDVMKDAKQLYKDYSWLFVKKK